VITGFVGFKKTIDGIGGLPITVPVAVRGAGADVYVKAGPNKLTGREALAYGRQRHSVAGGDFGRSANQGLLIMAAGAFTKLVGPARLPGILHAAAPNVSTNLSAEQVLTFAAGVFVTSPRKVHNRVAAGQYRNDGGWPVDRSVGHQSTAVVCRHQGWQPVVIVGVLALVA